MHEEKATGTILSNQEAALEAEIQKRLDDYNGPAVLRPDLIRDANCLRTMRLKRALKIALIAIDELIASKPMLAAKMCGTTTLGNVRAEIQSVLDGK